MTDLETSTLRAFSRAASTALAALALQLAPAPARAADPASPSDASKTAEQLANEAYEQHAAGKYGEAIATYLRAYEISRASVVLFNVARIYDHKLHEGALAMEYYRRYLGSPDAEPELVQKATQRLSALKLEADAAKKTPLPTPVVTPAPPPSPEKGVSPPLPAGSLPSPAAAPPASAREPMATDVLPERKSSGAVRSAGVVVGVAGVLSVGTGLVLGWLAKTKNDDANRVCNGATCLDQHGVGLAKDAGTFATASNITVFTGLPLVVGGLVMYLAAPKSTSTARVTVGPAIGLTSAAVSVGGSF